MNDSQTNASLSLTQRVLRYPATHLVIAIVWLGAWLFALLALKIKPAVLFEAIGAVVITIAYVLYVRVVERRGVSELAPEGAPAEFGEGFILGAALFTITIGIIWALGDYAIIGVNHWTAILSPLALGLAAGVMEEVLFRGVVFRITEDWIGSWGALVVSSLLFGAVHLVNPNATLVSALAIALEAGVLLGAAFMVTRRLWLPIGLACGVEFHAVRHFRCAGFRHDSCTDCSCRGFPVRRGRREERFGPEASLPAATRSSFCCLDARLRSAVRTRRAADLAAHNQRRRAGARCKFPRMIDFSKARVLVTGGAGFIGSALVWELNRRGCERIVIADFLESSEKWRISFRSSSRIISKPTICSRGSMSESLGRFDVVLHMGACSSTTERDAAYLVRNNYEFTQGSGELRALVQRALRVRIFRRNLRRRRCGDEDDASLPYLHTLRPLNMYGYSKQLFDLLRSTARDLDKIVGREVLQHLRAERESQGRHAQSGEQGIRPGASRPARSDCSRATGPTTRTASRSAIFST